MQIADIPGKILSKKDLLVKYSENKDLAGPFCDGCLEA